MISSVPSSLRYRERADRVVRDDAAGVTDHVRVALLEPEQGVRVEPRVHARYDGDLHGWRKRTVALVEALGVAPGVVQKVVCLAQLD